MKTEEEIRKERDRCEEERDISPIGSDRWRQFNIRFWALNWVLSGGRCSVKANHKECTRCGKEWNVSKYQTIPKGGYICPHCTSKEREERKDVSVRRRLY